MIRSVMTAMALAQGSGPSPDALVKHQSKKLALQVPAAWERTTEEGTEKFSAPSGEAFFTLDVGAVQTAGMKPAVCLDKIVTAIGGSGWEKLSVGRHPAAKKVDLDEVPDAGMKVRSVTYVGCDGKTTWSLIVTMDDAKKAQLEPVVSKIVQSVSYAPPK